MDRETAIETLRRHEAELRRRGVRHAALFGSVARGEARAESDLDVLVDIDATKVRTVYDYAGLCNFIEDLFPVAVDVADRATLKERVRARAEQDAVPAF